MNFCLILEQTLWNEHKSGCSFTAIGCPFFRFYIGFCDLEITFIFVMEKCKKLEEI